MFFTQIQTNSHFRQVFKKKARIHNVSLKNLCGLGKASKSWLACFLTHPRKGKSIQMTLAECGLTRSKHCSLPTTLIPTDGDHLQELRPSSTQTATVLFSAPHVTFSVPRGVTFLPLFKWVAGSRAVHRMLETKSF